MNTTVTYQFPELQKLVCKEIILKPLKSIEKYPPLQEVYHLLTNKLQYLLKVVRASGVLIHVFTILAASSYNHDIELSPVIKDGGKLRDSEHSLETNNTC